MNLFTQVVNYIEQYVETTKPLLNEGEVQFPEIEGKLEFCVRTLKDHPDYQGNKPKIN